MNEVDVLLSQMDSLKDNLTRASNSLGSEKLDENLRKAVQNRFAWQIQAKMDILADLRKQSEAGKALNIYWGTFLSLRRECEGLFSECLAFVEGALVRSAGMDGGLCRLADALLAELAYDADVSWDRFTIMAEAEFITNITEIIRLKYPEFSLWSLPIMAHEFGHFALEQVQPKMAPNLFDQMVLYEGKAKAERKDRDYLHEQFADLFAVYSLGPAFACTAILLSFNPAMADLEGESHPSMDKRVHYILVALDLLNQGSITKPFTGVHDQLLGLWQQGRQAIGKPTALPAEVIPNLETRLFQFYTQIIQPRFNKVRYNRFQQAKELAGQLAGDKTVDQIRGDSSNLTLRDILNAAWLARLEHGEKNLQAIHQKAMGLSYAIL